MGKSLRMSGKSFLNASGVEMVAVLHEGIDPDVPQAGQEFEGFLNYFSIGDDAAMLRSEDGEGHRQQLFQGVVQCLFRRHEFLMKFQDIPHRALDGLAAAIGQIPAFLALRLQIKKERPLRAIAAKEIAGKQDPAGGIEGDEASLGMGIGGFNELQDSPGGKSELRPDVFQGQQF